MHAGVVLCSALACTSYLLTIPVSILKPVPIFPPGAFHNPQRACLLFRAGLQGGPHNHTISGLACALKQAQGPEFRAYQTQVGLVWK